MKVLNPSKYFSNWLTFPFMEGKQKKLLNARVGLALLQIINERKEEYKKNKLNGIKDHTSVSSLRKLAAASGIDFGSLQKISKGYKGLEFFTLIDILDALNLNLEEFSVYFYAIDDSKVNEIASTSQKRNKSTKKKK